ncbi:helix-turn-helix domain-containing protein [Chitinimonas lacunae]|uniref:Helix-turn-helix domain-containing protein n=1 Tax=Chitinimonas lacunae TaxID=1963018 RepID=A0ABV8MLN8_9NEIS
MSTSLPSSDSRGRVAGTHAAFVVPSMPLASCIRCYVVRNTLKAAPMSPWQRFNHFAALPYATITWFFQGECESLWIGEKPLDFRFTPIFFCGPFSQPMTSYNPGPVDALTISLMPGAIHLLTGLDVAAYTDRLVPVEEIFDDAWQAMAKSVYEAPDQASRIARIEAFLEPLWQAARTRNGLRATWFQDCLNGLSIRAVNSDWSRSVRQLERRIRTWTGLPMVRLRSLQRSEDGFFGAVAAHQANRLSWAEVAAETGFADQAHFCRETRRVTGVSPTELVRKMLTEESYWPYRIFAGDDV